MKKIAVIGAGITGNAAAWVLSKTHDVTLYEGRSRLGGHSATVSIEHSGQQMNVDTGFIVYNEHNYPLLTQLFDHLQVETQKSDMSFGVSIDDGKMEWSGQGFGAVFAQRKNLFSPGFISMLREIFKFNAFCKEDLKSGALCGHTFEEYLKHRNISDRLTQDYLLPMTAAIWSTPAARMLDFPAESLVRFMDNHRLIHNKAERPKWRTVTGGSKNYVSKLMSDYEGSFKINSEVVSVQPIKTGPHNGKVEVKTKDGAMQHYDEVVMATHSDQSLKMLASPTILEQEILGAIGYKPNKVYLHNDARLMPKRRAAWSAWNYLGNRVSNSQNSSDRESAQNGGSEISLTYWMNRLQNLDPSREVFVTLNPAKMPKEESIFGEYEYSHPQFCSNALIAQKRLNEIQGKHNIWYCGAWTRYGFHEDGLMSGLNVANSLGAYAPWQKAEKNSFSLNFSKSAQPHDAQKV